MKLLKPFITAVGLSALTATNTAAQELDNNLTLFNQAVIFSTMNSCTDNSFTPQSTKSDGCLTSISHTTIEFFRQYGLHLEKLQLPERPNSTEQCTSQLDADISEDGYVKANIDEILERNIHCQNELSKHFETVKYPLPPELNTIFIIADSVIKCAQDKIAHCNDLNDWYEFPRMQNL